MKIRLREFLERVALLVRNVVRYSVLVREPLKTWRFRGILNRRRDAINHAGFFQFTSVKGFEVVFCSPLVRNAHIIRVRFTLASLALFPLRAAVVKFPLFGIDNVPLSPSNFTLSLAPHTQMRGIHFPFATVAVLLSILVPPPSTPFLVVFLVGSYIRNGFVCTRNRSDPRAACNEYALFSLFFSERKYPLFGVKRARVPG